MKGKAKKLKTLVIKRSKWARGMTDESALRVTKPNEVEGVMRPSGTMCCLGFLARECGATTKQINGKLVPSDVPNVAWPAGLVTKKGGHTKLCDKIVEVNDSVGIDVADDREKKLTKLFTKIGYKLVFK